MTMPKTPSSPGSSPRSARPLVRAYSMNNVGSIMRIPTLADSLHASYGRPSHSEHVGGTRPSTGPAGRRKCYSEGDMEEQGMRRSIKFDKVIIREYNRSVGDNPSVSGGPPLGLSWEYNPDMAALALEDYESTRGPRRTSKQMAMPRSVREEMLRKEWGVKQTDIAQAVRESLRIKNSRRRTVMNLESPMVKVEEKMEGVKKGLKRSLGLRKSFNRQFTEWQSQAEKAAILAERLDAEAMIAEENAAAAALDYAEEAEAGRTQGNGMSAADVSGGHVVAATRKTSHPIVVIREDDGEDPASEGPFEEALKDWSFLAGPDDDGEDGRMPIKTLYDSQSSGAPTSEAHNLTHPGAPAQRKTVAPQTA
eukprot:CAMPEP_0178504628 /NCGR_PEP_ID=MMETSP0696-20121128/18694_1 /TAXON_ID=265572 /ORGANISM="Extubocellulus spinifer, Strain CCMP396" /LENGTH=364 /DNA_ID=CAMNT_0020133875 /DNA_START=140 /DNA_END=1234 /DNA_ORIENTATION=-